MDDIIDFLNDFTNKYPKSWFKFEDYVVSFLPKDNYDDGFLPKSKYIKEHICKFTTKGIEFKPKEKSSAKEIKNSASIFDAKLLDYEEVFKDYEKDFFDVESWCSERLEIEIKLIRDFLFDCSIFKGTYFIQSLLKELLRIEEDMNNLWQSFTNPNWLQKEIDKELKVNLKYLKEVIIDDFSGICPRINETLNVEYEKTQTNTSIPSQSTRYFWYKFAQLLANGTLYINNEGYYFKDHFSYNAPKTGKLILEHLGSSMKVGTVKSFLTETKSSSGNNNDIFIKDRFKELTLIASEAKNDNCLSDYFKKKLEALKLKLSDDNS